MSIHPDQVDLGEISILTQWDCPSGVAAGMSVYQTAANAVDKADNGSIATMPCVGVVLSKPTPTTCLVTRQGIVNGYPPFTFIPKETYYVGTNGSIVNSLGVPTTPGVVVHEVGFAKNDTSLVVVLDADHTVL
ncbi:MAG TPA: hypothetical protein VFI02_18605 [Armatimonadota bacterium]|nr:hypothetical protein [Armatimonadota bacterium]